MKSFLKKAPVRFSLRFFLLAVLAFCVWLGWVAVPAHKQRRAVAWIRQHQGEVFYDYQRTVNPYDLRAPHWRYYDVRIARRANALVDWLGEDYFYRAEYVSFTGTEAQQAAIADLSRLRDMPHLRQLSIAGRRVDDDAMAQVARLQRLKVLSIKSFNITDAGIAKLVDLQELQMLGIHECQLTDEGLKPIAELRQLESLTLGGVEVDGEGFRYLQPMPNLKRLRIMSGGTHSPPAVEHIRILTNLEEFKWSASSSQAAKHYAGYGKSVQAMMPNCKIVAP